MVDVEQTKTKTGHCWEWWLELKRTPSRYRDNSRFDVTRFSRVRARNT